MLEPGYQRMQCKNIGVFPRVEFFYRNLSLVSNKVDFFFKKGRRKKASALKKKKIKYQVHSELTKQGYY